MSDESRVWIRKRKTKRGATYHLRWICPQSHAWKNRKTGTDKKHAERQAAVLEQELQRGTYQDIRRIGWGEFVDEHVRLITGQSHAVEARRTLREFGAICNPPSPTRIAFGMLESYVENLKAKGNSVATINKKMRYLRGAFNKAVRRSYLVKNPMVGWSWEREDRKPPRVLTDDEESRLLETTETKYGYRWWAFIYVALRTGGRRGELLGLTWDRVDFDDSRIHFANTKGHKDRFVPVNDDVIRVLRKLQAQTLQDGGPFVDMDKPMQRRWDSILSAAEVSNVTPHDLRRTYVTRLIRAGVPLPTVQKLAGHADIKTTLEYYNWVSDSDLREGVAKLAIAATG